MINTENTENTITTIEYDTANTESMISTITAPVAEGEPPPAQRNHQYNTPIHPVRAYPFALPARPTTANTTSQNIIKQQSCFVRPASAGPPSYGQRQLGFLPSFPPSFVDIVVDGQRQLGFLPLSDIVVDGQRQLGYLPPPTSSSMASDS